MTAVGLPGTLAGPSGQAAETLRSCSLCRGGRPHRLRRRRSTAARTTCSTTRCRSSASRSPSSTIPTTSVQWRGRDQPNTKVFFGETLANPKNDVFDIEGVAGSPTTTASRSSSTTRCPRRTSSARSNGVPTSWCTASPSSWAGTATRSAGRSPTAARSTSASAAASRTSPNPTRAITASPTSRPSGRRVRPQGPRADAARHRRRRSHRSTRSCCCRASRR